MGLGSNSCVQVWTSPFIHLFVGMTVLANDVKYCLMRPSVIYLFIFSAHLGTTRGPIHLQGFSENSSECQRKNLWKYAPPPPLFIFSKEPYWSLPEPTPPIVDICKKWESAGPWGASNKTTALRVNNQLLWPQYWWMAEEISCSDILKRNLWIRDMSMTGAA